ncbi:MAG: hypothetical protein U0X39_05320 [Bacteroidales bacterium]
MFHNFMTIDPGNLTNLGTKMKRNSFVLEFIKSFPFKVFIFLVIIILVAVTVNKCNEKKVQMKEDVLYIQPKPKT